MIKSCPRCSRDFECRDDDVFSCACIGVSLSKKEQDWLAANYDNCLCLDCLKEIRKMRSQTSKKIGNV